MSNKFIYHYEIECFTRDGMSELHRGKVDYPVPLTINEIRVMAEADAPMRFIGFGNIDITGEEYPND